MGRKYPSKLFWLFVFTNFVTHFFYLFVPGIILCLVGIWVKPCLWIGLAILLLDLILSIIEQLQIRKAAMTSNHPDVMALMDILNSPEGLHGVKEWADQKVAESTPINFEEEDA